MKQIRPKRRKVVATRRTVFAAWTDAFRGRREGNLGSRGRTGTMVVLLAMAAALAVPSLGAASAARTHHSPAPKAHAASYGYYCQTYVSPYSACPDGRSAYVTTVSYNQAYYSGGGYISVCEKIQGQGGTVQVSRYCNPTACYCNEADSGNSYGDLYDTQTFYVGNNSPNTHTINGYFAWNY